MTLRLGALQDALLDPGNAEKATRAAEELAGYDNRLSAIERDLTLLKWMVGTNVGLTLIVLGSLVGLAVRLLPLRG
jgi:hypothetical protein